MELLRVEHLSKIYGAGENQVKALDDVSLSVEKGEFVAIVGASGSGNPHCFICLEVLTGQQAERCI